MDAPQTKLRRLGRLTAMVARHPRVVLAGCTLLMLVSVLLAATGLMFKSDRSDLISPDAEFHQRWLEYCERFRETNELLVLLESSDRQELTLARHWLMRELLARETHFDNAMTHSSLEAWRELTEASYAKRMQLLQQRYGLARNISQQKEQATPLQQLLGAGQQEIQQQQQAEESESARQGELAPLELITRVTHSLEASLQSIDRSYERYFPSQPVVQEKFWNDYLRNHADDLPIFERSRQPAEAELAGSEPTDKAGQSLQELISVVPLNVAGQGAEKYGENLQILEQVLEAARQRFPATQFGVTGIPQLEHEEMARSQHDMLLSSLISLGGVVFLLLFGFRGLLLPLACCLTLACGMLWTLGFTTLVIGHLNILSMAFAAILVGLGIDFCIHLLSSYQDYRQQGKSVVTALGFASDTIGKGIITAAVTTAVAFLCAGLTDFPGVAELGIIAGGGVLLSAVATFLMFPALVSVMYGKQTGASVKAETARRNFAFRSEPIRKLIAFRPVLVLLMLSVPVGMISWQAWDWDDSGWECRVHYDGNLLNMQPAHLPAVEVQNKLQRGHEADVLYAVTWYDTREEAVARTQQFQQLPTVGRVTEIASQEANDLAQVNSRHTLEFLEQAERIPPPPEQLLPHNPAQVGLQLEQILKSLEESNGINETQLRLQLDHFLNRYANQPFEIQIRILETVEQEMIRGLWSEIRVRVADLKHDFQEQLAISEILTARYHNAQGDWLVQIHPRFDIWEDVGLAAFVQDLRSIDPQVTGTPIQNFEASRQLKNSYLNAALYAALAIVLVVILDVTQFTTIIKTCSVSLVVVLGLMMLKMSLTGQSEPQFDPLQLFIAYVACVVLGSLLIEQRECLVGLLALLPPIVGALLLLGVMALFELQFTPANLIALPLVMGIGIDDGVHVIHDYRRSRNRYFMSANTWRALVLTSLTSIIGFGSLGFASHRGLAGLGIVVVIGIASCLFAAVVVLPAMLSLFSSRRKAEAVESDAPITLSLRSAVTTLPLVDSTERLSVPETVPTVPRERWAA